MAGEKTTDGFTLVELAIVLVIIGLLIGGVLAGQNLIQEAKIRSQITQIQSYRTAIEAFRAKFAQLPGDFKNATKFWPDCVDIETNDLGDPSGIECNGNNNGIWDGNEGYVVFYHLALAGLVSFQMSPMTDTYAASSPFLKATNQILKPMTSNASTYEQYFGFPANNLAFLIFYPDVSEGFMQNQKQDPEVIASLDTKMDDGSGGSGIMRAYYGENIYDYTYDLSDLCVDSNGNYKIGENNKLLCFSILKY